jgi:hypothetical protein
LESVLQLLLCKSSRGKDIWRESIFFIHCATDNDLWYVEPFVINSPGRGYFGAVLTTWSRFWWDVMPLMFSLEHILFQFFKITAYVTLHSCRRCNMLKLTNMDLFFHITWNMRFMWLHIDILSKYYIIQMKNIARYWCEKSLIICTLLKSFLLIKNYSIVLMWIKIQSSHFIAE